MLSLSTLHS